MRLSYWCWYCSCYHIDHVALVVTATAAAEVLLLFLEFLVSFFGTWLTSTAVVVVLLVAAVTVWENVAAAVALRENFVAAAAAWDIVVAILVFAAAGCCCLTLAKTFVFLSCYNYSWKNYTAGTLCFCMNLMVKVLVYCFSTVLVIVPTIRYHYSTAWLLSPSRSIKNALSLLLWEDLQYSPVNREQNIYELRLKS